ncbi:MAG: hypothetical protein IM628_12780 [Phenylobacterium sp.]|uniref:hypothetical protein n=1 Tax=Phenylobacterium sp. TaxID=1871053 RepID=UPI0025DB63A4|nr:hypothetical protein [Phenylobacterium sp.]MCA6305673.1 hypothetical protein [Phenylobacterium sp.]
MLVPASETITKGEFAALIRRDPGRVSQMIGEGKIHGPALVGAGRTAKVAWRVALQQLGTALDLGQQLAQQNPIGLGLSAAEEAAPAAPLARGAVPINDDQKALLAAKREAAELDVARARRREMAEEGKWVDADAASQETARVAGEIVQAFDAFARQALPLALAEELGVDRLQARILIERLWRAKRTELAARLSTRAAALPELVPGEIRAAAPAEPAYA